MRLVIELGGRYDRTPDGAIWVRSGCLYGYWTRYLSIFDEVCLVARARDVPSVPDGMSRVDGEGVTFAGVPHYDGPWEYARQALSVRRAAQRSIRRGDAVLLCGSTLAGAMYAKLSRSAYPYAMRVIGDPYSLFAPGATHLPMRAFFRWLFTRQMKELCADACAAIYVTEHALQARYPCPGWSVGVSDVDLPPEAFVPAPRRFAGSGVSKIIMVGSLSEGYKAPHILLDAAAECIEKGLDITLKFAGDGKLRPKLAEKAALDGIGDRVTFLGQLANLQVRDQLDRADLFVLPSFQEGLPRAMVEAMARGLPCIGSAVGGIPELLPEEDLVPAGDANSLAGKIGEVLADPDRMARMSERNLYRAGHYREAELWDKWSEFYTYLRERTQEWLRKNSRQSCFT